MWEPAATKKVTDMMTEKSRSVVKSASSRDWLSYPIFQADCNINHIEPAKIAPHVAFNILRYLSYLSSPSILRKAPMNSKPIITFLPARKLESQRAFPGPRPPLYEHQRNCVRHPGEFGVTDAAATGQLHCPYDPIGSSRSVKASSGSISQFSLVIAACARPAVAVANVTTAVAGPANMNPSETVRPTTVPPRKPVARSPAH